MISNRSRLLSTPKYQIHQIFLLILTSESRARSSALWDLCRAVWICHLFPWIEVRSSHNVIIRWLDYEEMRQMTSQHKIVCFPTPDMVVVGIWLRIQRSSQKCFPGKFSVDSHGQLLPLQDELCLCFWWKMSLCCEISLLGLWRDSLFFNVLRLAQRRLKA